MGNSEVVKLKTPLGQSDGKHKGPDPQAQDTTAIGQSDWKLKGRGDGANPSSGSTTHEAVSDKLRSHKEEAKRLRQELHSLRMRERQFERPEWGTEELEMYLHSIALGLRDGKLKGR